MQIKSSLGNTMKLYQPTFSKGPKRFDTINMTFSVNKLICPVVNTIVLFIAQIHKTIIAAPAIRMNDTVRIYTTPDNGLQRSFSAIGDDFGVDSAAPFKDTENRCFPKGSSSSFTFYSFAAKIRFIDFDLPFDGRLLFI